MYNVNLEVFQGPLDLLLHLIEKMEIDIYNIPIAQLTESYLEYINNSDEFSLENAEEYIVMAATLLHIKSKNLLPKFEDETVALKLALTGAIKDQLLPMDEVTIFGLNYFKEHYPEKLAERFKQMKIEEEAPVIIMDMTRALGFRDDYDRFYSLFVKEVRDGKLGNYTLDTLEDLDGDD